MKIILNFSVKGGVGKSTVTANTGLATRDLGFRVGFFDFDFYGNNLPTALGLREPFPKLELDSVNQMIKAIKIDGYELYSLALRYGTTAAVMWQGGTQKVEAFGRTFILDGTGTHSLVKQMLRDVKFSELDYLFMDLPPSSGDITLSLFENLKNIWGVIIICQPTNLAVQDINRTLDMVKKKKIPLLGMVSNMAEAVCPHCGSHYQPFLDGGIDLQEYCSKRKIPLLAKIPFSPEKELVKPIFQQLAEDLQKIKPLRIWEKAFQDRFKDAILTTYFTSAFTDEVG